MAELASAFSGPLGLALLAAVAFGDALIGVSFFVMGEVAFLAAGALFAMTGSPLPIAVVMIAAWLADLASFLLGYKLGSRGALRFLGKAKARKAWRRAATALANYPLFFVVGSRLLGPVAWITPFMAGSLSLSFPRFMAASAIGVLLGVGQFCLFGALGATGLSHVGSYWESISAFAMEHLVAILFFAAMGASVAAILIVPRWSKATKFAVSTLTATSIFAATNLIYFFGTDAHSMTAEAFHVRTQSLCEAIKGPLVVKPGRTSLHMPQPVNVLLVSDKKPEHIMQQMGWHKNLTYTRDKVDFLTYLKLLGQNLLPISELYLDEAPADSAFQLPGTLSKRVHMRWWRVGGTDERSIYFGAISRDEELAIKYYRAIPAILHDIAPNVDVDRDALGQQVHEVSGYGVSGYAVLTEPVVESADQDYETDGRLLIVNAHTTALTPAEKNCLYREV
ncbi:hypothetical protein E1162_04385 [Rhodobacteraceae bacterium RKSG542]|uniref:LssY C-terminal domain-containing protein n=1 Tax=Pseudovibrio flavus TaxID=2529854 RepID=UPI0012BC4E92|nr:LssY C-terminal domain-containing protein [Pseudovibrio flavus]MTI16476.1 hypothetical protein [Pseudovibrio flavus]